ncbi:MAG TPA: POTRA domain-containing protein [Pyrinomonadaceae bacterium]
MRLPLLTLILLILVFPVSAQQSFKIAKIDFEGLNRVSADEMLVTTGLKIGDSFSVESLDAAAQRLVDSGLFKNVAYRTRPNKDQMTIVFQVEEAKVTSSRVIFDNFIWFSDVELIGAVKRDVPSFDGTAPDTGNTVDRVIKSLQRFLHENKIEATVTHMTSQDSAENLVQEHVFTVNGVPMPICTVNFPGASNIDEARLRESSKELRDSEYSRKFVSLFAQNNLIPLYRELGQLKAAFSPPQAKPEATATCKSGVEITIPVDEGAVYKWNKAEWTGNAAFNAQELDPLLGMQAGQPANGVKLDKASRDIQKAYGRKGFLSVKVKSVPEFDEQAQSVVYKMSVVEGSQFRMGRFTTRGFSETETSKLQEKWGLKTGAVFDAGYADEFSKKGLLDIMRINYLQRGAQGKPAPNIKWEYKPDNKTLTVDVTLTMTN